MPDYSPSETRVVNSLRFDSQSSSWTHEAENQQFDEENDPVLRLHLKDVSYCPNLLPVFEHSPSICSLEIQFSTSFSSFEEISRRGLSIDDAKMLARCMAISQCLIEIHLPNNNINDDVLYAMFPGLMQCLQLVDLDLSYNQISDSGAKLLSNLMRREYVLGSLNLSHNHITSSGCSRMAQRMNDSLCLYSLDLSVNRIDDTGAIDMFSALCSNETLLSLSLSCNELTERCMAFIAHSLRGNRTAKVIDVSGNGVAGQLTEAHFDILEDSFASNTTLEVLDLRGCGFSSEHIARLTRERKANDRILIPLLDSAKLSPTQFVPSPTVA